MTELPPIQCPGCERTIESAEFFPTARGGAPNATTYESCLRKCHACGLGFSNRNSNDPGSLTRIFLDPFSKIPRIVAAGYEEALASALNIRNRRAKAYKFASSESEDHVTWTVFRYLAQAHILGPTMASLSVIPRTAEEPALLLWGVPIPFGDQRASMIQERVKALSDSLGERSDSRSEPDVILDFGDDGVVVIEVKLRSGNDSLNSECPKWNRYLDASHAFADRDKAKRSGLYELARNWRIAFHLADNRPAKLINLGPETLWRPKEAARLELFRESLTLRPGSAFLNISWRQLFGNVRDQPDWLRKYVSDRRIPA